MTQTNEVQGNKAIFGLEGQREKLVSEGVVLRVQNQSQSHLLSGQGRWIAGWVWAQAGSTRREIYEQTFNSGHSVAQQLWKLDPDG